MMDSEVIRENEKILKSRKPTQEEANDFFANLWWIEGMTVFDNNLICFASDGKNGKRKKILLSFRLPSKNEGDVIPLFVHDITNIALDNNRLFKNKIYSYNVSAEGYIMYYSINLKEIIK